MKMKVLAFVAILFCMATYSIASSRMAQFVVTDCGTVHQIPGQCKNLRGNICKNPIFA